MHARWKVFRCLRISPLEHGAGIFTSVPSRRPTKAERERVVSLDLLADWRAYAESLPEPRSDHDWRYFGTVTMDGHTGALAWRLGGYGIGNGAKVRELGIWDRIQVNGLLMEEPPGYSNAPRFTSLRPTAWPDERCPKI